MDPCSSHLYNNYITNKLFDLSVFFFPVVGKVPVGGEARLDNWIQFSP